MAEQKLPQPLDLNRASREELIALPGIGPALADRILAARPFDQVDDLQRVSGIGPDLVEQLRPYLTVASSTDEAKAEMKPGRDEEPTPEAIEEAPKPAAAPSAGEETPEPSTEPAAKEESETPPEVSPEPPKAEEGSPGAEPSPEVGTSPEIQTTPEEVQASIPWGAIFLTGAASFLLALLVTLGVLSALNGGLRYTTPGQTQALTQQVTLLNQRADQLDAHVQDLERRLSQVEALAQQMDALQGQVKQLRSDLDGTQQQMQTFQQQVDTLNTAVEETQTKIGLFQRFLEGLQSLMNTLMEPQQPQPTPTPGAGQ